MMKCTILLFSLFLIFSSCQQEEKNFELKRTTDGNIIRISKDVIIHIDPLKKRFRNSEVAGENIVLDTLYGGMVSFRHKEWFKVVFTSDTKGFVPNKIYYAKSAICTRDIEIRGFNELTPIYKKENHMGFYPSDKIGEMEVGCHIYRSNSKIGHCVTQLLYVGYDENLQEVDAYYPIHPNRVIWYTAKSIYNWNVK